MWKAGTVRFELDTPGYAQELEPAQAFEQIGQWLWRLSGRPPLASRPLKEQFLQQWSLLQVMPEPGEIGPMSLQALAAGLLCGARDGARLYLLGERAETFAAAPEAETLRVSLTQYLEVADQEWRSLDVDTLQLQAGYGKHLNRATHRENIDFLAQPGRSAADARRALLETFRTGYSLGLIDAAVVFIGGQPPDPLL